MECALRAVTEDDIPFLWEMVRYAAHLASESPGAARDDPRLRMWVDEWGRPGDQGLTAFDPGSLRKLGAAWLRLLPRGSSTGYHDDQTPELGIAVLPDLTGQGIGTMLLSALIEAVKTEVPAVVLTVRTGNPARRLYRRLGFITIDQVPNRAGTSSSRMLLKFR